MCNLATKMTPMTRFSENVVYMLQRLKRTSKGLEKLILSGSQQDPTAHSQKRRLMSTQTAAEDPAFRYHDFGSGSHPHKHLQLKFTESQRQLHSFEAWIKSLQCLPAMQDR
jgi:hypothetical protein